MNQPTADKVLEILDKYYPDYKTRSRELVLEEILNSLVSDALVGGEDEPTIIKNPPKQGGMDGRWIDGVFHPAPPQED